MDLIFNFLTWYKKVGFVVLMLEFIIIFEIQKCRVLKISSIVNFELAIEDSGREFSNIY